MGSFRLTPRQVQIAELLLQGKNRREMTSALKVSRDCIRIQMGRMISKLDIPEDRHPRVMLALHIHRFRKQLGVRCQACGEC